MIIRAYSCSAAGENSCNEDYSRTIRFSGTMSISLSIYNFEQILNRFCVQEKTDVFVHICVMPQAIWQFDAGILSVSKKQTGVLKKQIHWFCSTIPLILSNDFNGFVERFQWICFGNLPLLLLPTVVLAACLWRFRLSRT